MEYRPDYDTTVQTVTEVRKQATWHRDGIDWNYPFDDPAHVAHMCCNGEYKIEFIARLKRWLRELEKGGDIWASDYGGYPRIWKRVMAIGMASCWPYWKPRPTLSLADTLGQEYCDWFHITAAIRNGSEIP